MFLLIQEDACALTDSEVSNSLCLNTDTSYPYGQWRATRIRLPLLSLLVQCVDEKSCVWSEHIAEVLLAMPCLGPCMVGRTDARLKNPIEVIF
jgi:hypothetical protein